MKMSRSLTGLMLVGVLLTGSGVAVFAQAQQSLAVISVTYGTQKQKVQPTGELKVQIDALDAELREAQRLGQTGTLRRLYAKGLRLLAGGAWTDELDFARSLILRTDRLVVDPSAAWDVRLEQIYAPSIALAQPLRAHISLRRPARPRTATQAAQPATQVRDLGTRDGVSRDLRDAPLALRLDVSGVDDGRYQLVVEVSEGTRTLGTVMQPVEIRGGLDAAVARLHQAARTAPETLRASILYPVDRVSLVNRGVLPLGSLDADADFAVAEAVATAAVAGMDPFDGRTGDMKRHYVLESAGEVMPYRLYVPTTYRRGTPAPVVIALHGLGGNENSMFDAYGGGMTRLAEQHGFIVAAPLGYRQDGWYGWEGTINRNDPEAARTAERSEEDVLQVLAQVKSLYTVDETRVYLMGHSMGAIGTWHLGAKYPDVWAALGPIAGIGSPATVERMRDIPQFVVHGDADPTVAVTYSRAMVARMKALDMQVTYIEIPGGDHVAVVAPHLPAMFEFFTQHRKASSR